MADLDLAALRLDAAALLNGGGREGRREQDLDDRETRLRRDRAALRRERAAVRREARLVIAAWVALLTMTCALCAFWPTLMGWADLVWRR